MIIEYNSNQELGKDVEFLLDVSQNSQPKYSFDKFIYWIYSIFIIFGMFGIFTLFPGMLPDMPWRVTTYATILEYMDIIIMFLYPLCLVFGYFNPERSFATNFKYHFWNMQTPYSNTDDWGSHPKREWLAKFTRYLSGYFTADTNLKVKVFKYRAYIKFHNIIQILCLITIVVTCFIIGYTMALDHNRNIHPYELRHIQNLMWDLMYMPAIVEILRATVFSGTDASTYLKYAHGSDEFKAKYKYHEENENKLTGG
jgi:hypothetical protein